jgi:RimJ/RimL family protein N-acetyltransferase
MVVMELQGYGITLKRLTLDKIEMLRNWRNDPKIQQYMEYREYITPEMQRQWFDRINNEHNYYFIISIDNNEIGLVNLKDIDYERKCAEPGIFIYEDAYLNGDVGIRAALLNTDFAFQTLNLDFLYGHVLKSNKRAIRFNSVFGYELSSGQDDVMNQLYTLKKEVYFQKREFLKKILGV